MNPSRSLFPGALLLVLLSCSTQNTGYRDVFKYQQQYVRATRLAVDGLRECSDKTFTGPPPECEVTSKRDEIRKAWYFRFVFLPESPDYETSVLVYDDGKTECFH